MRGLLFYMLQVIVSSGILYAYYHFFLRNKKFHQYNRFYLLAIIILSLVIPAFNFPVYFTPVHTSPSIIYQTLSVISAGESQPVAPLQGGINGSNVSLVTSPLNWANIAWSFYILVSVIVLAKFISAINKIRLLLRKYPAEKLNTIYFIDSEEPGTPFSFFKWMFWNNRIELASDDGQKIFRHELFHIQQKHSWDIILMEILTVVFWINPFYHLVKKEIRAIHEFLADRFAIENSENWQYAELLLVQALGIRSTRLTNPFFHNQIKRRITMITTSQKPRYQYLRKIMVLPLVAIVLTLFAFKYKSMENPPVQPPADNTITVVIDAAHGGTDIGAMSNGVNEKDIALAIAKKIKELNRNDNIKLVFTRLDDSYTGLREDAAVADDNNADILISIHANAEPGVKIANPKKGMEIYISSKKEDNYKSEMLAMSMITALQNTYTINKSILKRKVGIYVLDQPKCPGIIIECGYLTNREDRKFITDEKNQETIARNILDAISNYAAKLTSEGGVPVKQGGENEGGLREESHQTDSIPSKTYFYIDAKTTKLTGYYKGNKISSISFNKSMDVSMTLQNGRKVELTKHQAEMLGVPMPEKQLAPATQIKMEATVNAGSPRPYLTGLGNPLLIVDGVEMENNSDLNTISPNDIESINVLKDPKSILKYGDKGRDGVIEIITRDKKKARIPSTPITWELNENGNHVVFEKAETDPGYPGGDAAFKEYIQQNLNYPAGAQNGFDGSIKLKFIVGSKGDISDINVIDNPGSAFVPEAVRLLKNSKWMPAIQNGHKVPCYYTITVPLKYFAPLARAGKKIKESSNLIFEKAETDPAFPGGDAAFKEYIQQNMNYPEDVQNDTFNGSIKLKLVIDSDGDVSDINVLDNKEGGFVQEAVRLLKNSKWIPAMQNGHKVTCYQNITIPLKYFEPLVMVGKTSK